jgi:hypothetical protein
LNEQLKSLDNIHSEIAVSQLQYPKIKSHWHGAWRRGQGESIGSEFGQSLQHHAPSPMPYA